MRDVSTRFKESQANIEYIVNAILNDGAELEFTNKDILGGGIEITDVVSSDSTFDIGACLARQLTLRLNNAEDVLSEYDFTNAQIYVSAKKAVSSEAVESVSLGKYILDLPEFSGSTIILNCLDYMVMLNKKIDTEISGTTMGAVVNSICTRFGLTLATPRFAGWDTEIVLPDMSDMTYIELLTYICQATCNFARMNDAGQLEIKWYDTSVFDDISQVDAQGFDKEQSEVIDGGDFTTYQTDNIYDAGSFDGSKYHHLYSNKTENILTDDVVITGISVKNEDAEYLYGTDGYVLLIEDNPLTVGKEQQYAEQIGLRCVGMRFRPFSISAQSNMLIEAGDACIVTDRKGNSYYSYVTSTTYKVGTNQTVACSAESPVLNSADKFSLVTKAVIKARKETEQKITAYDIAVQQLTELMANSFGVFKTAEEQEDGSVIYYMHNRPTLEESKTIWKMTADAFAVSTDGGNTWNAGLDAQGNAVVNILNAIGINADWINAGTLTGRAINNGNGTFKVDESGNVTANSLESNNAKITGGTINISTDSNSFSVINLNTTNEETRNIASLAPGGMNVQRIQNDSNKFLSVSPEQLLIMDVMKGVSSSLSMGRVDIRDTDGNYCYTTPKVTSAENATTVYYPNAVITCSKLLQASDARLKTNREKISEDELKLLDLISLCSFCFKSDESGERRFGMYAQELLEAMKTAGLESYDLVEKGENGYYAIDYAAFIPLLLEDRKRTKQEMESYRKNTDDVIAELIERIEVLEEHGNN